MMRIIKELLEQVNALPVEAVIFEHETRGMELVINDGRVVDIEYDTDMTQF